MVSYQNYRLMGDHKVNSLIMQSLCLFLHFYKEIPRQKYLKFPPLTLPFSPMRLCRNDEGGWIPAEQAVRLLSFGIMCWIGLSVGCPALGFYKLTDR